jgi:hypothetical protein
MNEGLPGRINRYAWKRLAASLHAWDIAANSASDTVRY